MKLNISPSTFDVEQINEDQELSCQVFFNSTTKVYNHQQIIQPQHHHHHHKVSQDDCSSYRGESPYDDDDDETNNKVDNGLKLTLWSDPFKWEPWMKMNIEEVGEDEKLQPSSSDLSSNNIVKNSPTIRVCSDCNTTKTPLWRSGPKGPKSLCNACGIRQRKARRAMAAAAAAAAAQSPPSITKIKAREQNKQKICKTGHGHDSNFKKRSKITAIAAGSSSPNGPKNLNLEDLLTKLSKNLALQRVFPQDEKDAAILLMSLSSG